MIFTETVIYLKLEKNWANPYFLSKIRHYVAKHLLRRAIYYSLFISHLIYGYEIWGQNQDNALLWIWNLQEKTLRVTDFKRNNGPTNILFEVTKILWISYFIQYKDIKFVRGYLGQTNLILRNKVPFTKSNPQL